MRRIAFALAVLASWMILLLWAARVDWTAPFSPAEEREFPGDDFSAVFGTGSAAADRLRVESSGADYTSLQSLNPSDLDAEKFPTLRYRFADFPRTLELSLVFRTADSPEDVAISLPWPGNGARTFDLSRVPEWHGRIVELGFAQFPTAQLVPPAQGFKPFEIVDAALWSRSWRGDLAALATDWFGAWPWSQRSVHALGRDTDTPRARSLVLCVALAAVVALAWMGFVFGWRNRLIAVSGAGIIAIAWLALDVGWEAGLWGRLQTTRAVYAHVPWWERQHIVADTDIAAAAVELRTMLLKEPRESRILVYADPSQGYELLRFIWHLLPRNAAPYVSASLFGVDALPEGSLIVFFHSDEWRTNSTWRQLLAHSEHLATPGSIHGDGFDNPPVVVFRFHHVH
jgi:hypothetical protein